MKLSILIPVYNEQKTVREIVEKVLNQQTPGIQEMELVIVDDASQDKSRKLLTQLADKYPEIRLIFQETNQGKGAAIARAIDQAHGDIGIIQDADLEYEPSDYPTLITPIIEGRADVVYGSRFMFSGERRVLYFKHALGNRFLTWLSNWFTDLYLTDMETCYKAFRLKTLQTIPLRSKRFGIEPEFTAKVAKRNLRVYEVPIQYHGRTYAEGKKITWKDGFSAVYTIFKFWLIDDIYEENYGLKILEEMQEAPKFSEWTLDLVAPYLADNVLEVGSGIGNNLQALLTKTETVIATEMEEKYIPILENGFAQNPAVTIKQWDVTEGPLELKDRPQTILCSNVLEHIEAEDRALQNMHDILERDGNLVLIIPQGQHLFSSLDKHLHHFRRYDKQSLAQVLARNGFQLQQLVSFNKAGVIGWYWKGKIRKATSLGKGNLKLFNVLVPLFRIIDPALPWKGLSWVAVANKVEQTENTAGLRKSE